MAYPPVVIVDIKDKPVGLAMLKDAVAQGLYYRVVAVAVTDESGRILLQKRSMHMRISPGKWDISVGGHVDAGQTYEAAALNELAEELSVTGLQPKVFGKEFLGDCFLQLFTLVMPPGTQFHPEAHEVSEVKWLTPEEFVSLVRDHPQQCADFLLEIYSRTPGVFGLPRTS